MLVLVVNNSLTPSLRNDLQLEGTRPCGYYALISSSPVPLPPKRRQFVATPMDSPGGSPPRRGWETLDDDLWEKSHATLMSSPPQDSVLPAPTFSRRCLNRLGKRPCLLVFHASSRRRFFYGTILRTVHRSLVMVARLSARVADVER